MKRMLMVLAVVLAVVTAQAADTNLLTGVDLMAWKIARTQVRHCDLTSPSECWTLPEDARPLASTMKKTETDDYEFSFVLVGKKEMHSQNQRDERVIDMSSRRILVVSKVATLGKGMLRADGVKFVRDLKPAKN